MELCPGAALDQLEEGIVQAKQKLELAKKQFSALCGALNHNSLEQEGDELQTAILLAKQAKIDKLDLAVKLAMKELQQAETALSYHTGKIPGFSTHTALTTSMDSSNLEDMDPDRSNAKHNTLMRPGIKVIPVFHGTKEIDWDHVGLSADKDCPTLDLTSALKDVTLQDFEFKLVEAIYRFLELYEERLRHKYTNIFDDVAWSFMAAALEPCEMGSTFHGQIKGKPHTEGTFSKVKNIIWMIFNLGDLSAPILA
ncbi:hypothetical protein BG005_003558 [Podila minutissima]|nr:hypothetical protein BG005_003558 [Podila minutissima]